MCRGASRIKAPCAYATPYEGLVFFLKKLQLSVVKTSAFGTFPLPRKGQGATDTRGQRVFPSARSVIFSHCGQGAAIGTMQIVRPLDGNGGMGSKLHMLLCEVNMSTYSLLCLVVSSAVPVLARSCPLVAVQWVR